MDNTILNITLKKGTTSKHPSPAQAALHPQLIFQGSANKPFLAPRGVFLIQNKLIVADTGRNRVFIWHTLPASTFCEPDVVLGQDNTDATGRNAGGEVSAASLQYPSGIWSDGQRLIVADAWNHRVLIWHQMPTRHGQPADVVIGQPGFDTNQPNAQKVGADPHERSLFWPYGLFSDGQHLWVADTGNRRILFYENIPTENFASAQQVIGQPDFSTRDYDNHNPVWPYSIKVGPNGALLVADTQYYRVLLWQDWRKAATQPADCVIGQAGLEGNGQNQYGLHPMANTLSWCYDACFYKQGLLVADAGNSRVLRFLTLPQGSDAAADGVIGKPDFFTGSENAETVFGTEKSLYWPFSICTEGNQLAVADTGNHRVVIYGLGDGH